MTTPLGAYTFLPWLRNGIANLITTNDGDASVLTRATVATELDIVGERPDGSTFVTPLDRTVPLVGPGDIVGIDPRAIVRTDPRPWITNYEPEYLAAIDFYDEDFPWRYTPAAPDTVRHRLRPWVALVVLTEEEFTDQRPGQGRPLPALRIQNVAVLPDIDELWAWAHVHVMQALVPGSVIPPDLDAATNALNTTLGTNADLACSRLLSPRRLVPDTAYHAFLVPSFERGRLAGLGEDPDGAPHATVGAWDVYPGRPQGDAFPYYFRWFFRTGAIGDFEYLVRLLQPRPVDGRVGTRDIDVTDPGANLPPIDDPALAGVLKLGGALRVPRASLSQQELEIADRYEGWAAPYPRPFQERMASFVNLADSYNDGAVASANADAEVAEVDNDPDPFVTAPLYGRWHAATQRLLTKRDGSPAPNRENWVHELNLDPRHRTAAGFGTQVIQNGQEDYMQSAWEQVGDVIAANRVVRWAQVALAASWRWHSQHLQPMAMVRADRALALTSPLHARVLRAGSTVLHATRESVVPRAVLSAPLRRVVRPGARLTRSLAFTPERAAESLPQRVAQGEATAAAPRTTPRGAVTLNDVAAAVERETVPRAVGEFLEAFPSAPTFIGGASVLLMLIIWAATSTVGALVGLAVAAAGLALRARLQRMARARRAARALREESHSVAAVDALPPVPDFQLDASAAPSSAEPGADSPDASRFRLALREAALTSALSQRLAPEPRRLALNVAATSTDTVRLLDPALTIPARTWRVVKVPSRIRPQRPGALREVMYYPVIDTPMYRPLTDISGELFLPNLNRIPANSITLLETNQRFIEAYMVGLNHEFSRELLWREYPTDARGSCFRQFWDVGSHVDELGRSGAELREALRDIPPLHTWLPESDLGTHDHREQERGTAEEDVVLVIRGELLKRYPNAVIYAQRAEWPRVGGAPGAPIDRTRQRDLIDILPSEVEHPPADKVRTPLYEAKVDPDIYFFGFDLTVESVVGGSGDLPTDDPGWFFVIKERPGEPRFGFDDGPANDAATGSLQVWNELTWGDTGTAPGALLRVATLPNVFLSPVPSSSPDDEKRAQHAEDLSVPFSASTNAAELAYVLFQAPVLVAVHAAEMLRKR